MNRKIESVSTTFNKHKPFLTPLSCCNPWRELISHPFAENAIIVGIDINSLSQSICVFKTDIQGRPSCLNIEVTHWLELGDMCKPGARKCRFVSPEEKELRDHFLFRENVSFFSNITKNLLSIIAVFFIISSVISYIGKTFFYSFTIDKIGNNVSKVVQTYNKK